MIRVAVYDSVADDCEITADAVRTCFENRHDEVELSQYTDGEAFVLMLMRSGCDMLFIGIESMLDVETARSAARIGKKCPLFLVSRVADYGIEGFRLSALDYLIKPVTKERVGEALNRIDEMPWKLGGMYRDGVRHIC